MFDKTGILERNSFQAKVCHALGSSTYWWKANWQPSFMTTVSTWAKRDVQNEARYFPFILR